MQKQPLIITTIITESRQKQITTEEVVFTNYKQYIKELLDNTNIEIQSLEKPKPDLVEIKGYIMEGDCPSIYIIITTSLHKTLW